MMYLTDKVLTVPAEHDREALANTLAAIFEQRAYITVSDRSTAEAVARTVSPAQIEHFTPGEDDERRWIYHHTLPIPTLQEGMKLYPYWKQRSTGTALAIARGVSSMDEHYTIIDRALTVASDDELRALIAKHADDAAEPKLRIDAMTPFELCQRLIGLATDEQIPKLVKRTDHSSVDAVARALSDAQLVALERTDDPWRDAIVRFELLARGLCSLERLERDLALIEAQSNPYWQLMWVSVPTAREREYERLLRAPRDHALAIANAGRHAQPLAARLRRWHERQRVTNPGLANHRAPHALLALAVVFDDAAAQWFAEQITNEAASLRKAHDAMHFAHILSDAFMARADADQCLASLGKRLKGKVLGSIIEQASTRVSNLRSECGLTSAAPIPWGNTDDKAALRLLIQRGGDHWQVAAEGLDPKDPVGSFNAFAIAFEREWQLPEGERSSVDAVLAFCERALPVLEQSFDESAPDGLALRKRIGGEHDATYRFQQSTFGAYLRSRAPRERTLEFVERVLLPLYTQSKNAVFKRWIEPYVHSAHPELVEKGPAKLARLTRELSATKGKRVPITLVFRSDRAADARTINRLFGAPIGVSEDRWPRFDGKPMEHLITLETAALPHEAARYAARGVAAIAVFLSSLDGHEAITPHSAHAAVVELSADELARGAAESSEAATALEVVHAQVPEALFRGGAKKGALFELRRLLDQEDFLSTHLTAPRWLQAPEPAGTFLFDLSGRFAAKLNTGDEGRLFVFADTALIQSA